MLFRRQPGPGRGYARCGRGLRGPGAEAGAAVLIGGRAADEVQALWALLRPRWGPARDVRPVQPVMVITGPPLVPPDPLVRRVRMEDFDVLWPACVAMFTEEVGVSPTAGDGGASYRARLEQLIRGGRAFARIEGGKVIFKAEIGAVTPQACQVQGVWVRPECRGQGLAAPGMAAVVVEAARSIAPLVSLYVNDYNRPAARPTGGPGFADTGRSMSVLF